MLVARALAYALTPASPLQARLGGELGGPRPLVVGLAAFAIAGAVAAGMLWLCAIGVRERHRLDPAGLLPPPRLRLGSVPLRAAALCCSGALVAAALESYLHWRAGLGFHGLDCLIGPVHQDLLPILGALSLLAAALAAAAELALAWMRRQVALILAARPRPGHGAVAIAGPRPALLRRAPERGSSRPRAPPPAGVPLAR
ncbi:MAG: hypothetical protein QOK40_3230 [Miltoncostaeaceae bacterium]|nr:hypothetical protein [Miltoncostaeaceae bacterium]